MASTRNFVRSKPKKDALINTSTGIKAKTYKNSKDGRRGVVDMVSVHAVPAVVPDTSFHAEDLQTAEALERPDFSYLHGDADGWDREFPSVWHGSAEPEPPGIDDDGIELKLGSLKLDDGKDSHFTRWSDADNPMRVFVTHFREETLDEQLRAEGQGSPEVYAACAECNTPDPLYRCEKQACIGAAMYCEGCIVRLHRQLSTHRVERWCGEFFVPLALNDLQTEARIQLGHRPGTYCQRARPAHKDFVIIDVLGIRVVKLNFCGCDSEVAHRQQLMRACLWPATSKDPQTCATFNVIRLFELQNCLGKISAYDFVRSLEMLSNNDGMETVFKTDFKGDKTEEPRSPPDRRKAFRAIVRQYRMMEMIKRAGRGHDDTGVAGTKQGELALRCRACPQAGWNLPDGWDTINWDSMDEDQRYKYFTELAEDANFKLINRNVSTEERDPVVDDGCGFFANRVEYKEHIRKNVDEEEISSCSGFQAMFLANAKRVKGLRVTGIGGVTCARHNMWRPNGIGDLQVGERHCNMDFLMFAALLGCVMSFLIMSYDVACQFSKNIWTRMPKLPKKYHLKIDPTKVRWMVPNFHLPAHKKGCHSAFSFHWLWGGGGTHGETVEQNWEFLNGIAGSTKLMGLGVRYTALEGLFGFHNWRRLIAHRRILMQRMAEAMIDGKKHKASFEAFTAGLKEAGELDVEKWQVQVDKWEREIHEENATNSPYEYEAEGMTLKQIRLELGKEEYSVTGDGTEVEREDTPSTFLTMGMDIEETQRQLAIAIKAAGPILTTSQELDFLKRRTVLRVRLAAFRKLQKTYMPKARTYLTPSQKLVWDADAEHPEATRLFMPSDLIDVKSREKACAAGLDGVEARLRTGEVGDALADLRQALRTRTMTNRFKIRNWSGQRALTRGQGILRQINIKIHAAKLRYRYARQAILKLKGHGEWERDFPVLKEEDVRAINDRALREEEQAQDKFLGALGMAKGPVERAVVAAGEGHHVLSWIWFTSPKAGVSDAKLHEALRVEWCKAYSLDNRNREHLVKLEEEMRRTIHSGESEQAIWMKRASARSTMLGGAGKTIDPAVMEGVRAYALEQADRERRVCEKLVFDWAPLRARAAAYLRGEDLSSFPKLEVPLDEDQLRWAEAKMYTEEETEGDMYQ